MESARIEESHQRAQERKQSSVSEAKIIKDAENAYRDLTHAQSEYLRAVKEGDAFEQERWSRHIEEAEDALCSI